MVHKQVKALTVLYLVPYQHFGVDFAPYQILLVMGAVLRSHQKKHLPPFSPIPLF